MRIEIYLDKQWRHCADLIGTPGSRQSPMQLAYAVDHAVEHLFARDIRAVSARIPVDLGVREYAVWPAFLIDLLPQGAARRRLEQAAVISQMRSESCPW